MSQTASRGPDVESASFLIQQLPYIAPMVVVYAVGVVLSLVYLRRCPLPATLALIGSALLLVTTIGVPLLQGFALEGGGRRGSFGRPDQLLQVIGLGGTLLRTAGYALLLAAVFTGRRGPPPLPHWRE
jgi:hypothetical protein